MNERIQELAERAGINCVVPTVGTLEYPSKGEVDHLKKFAELIVWECIRLCDQVDIVGADECIDNIKEHFGVEQ